MFTRPRGFKKEILLGASTTELISLSTSERASDFPVPETAEAEFGVAVTADTVCNSLERKRLAHDFGAGGGEATASARSAAE